MTDSSDAIRDRYRARLGPAFGDAFHALRNQWAWALMRRDEYRELFARAEDVALLNAVTGGAFAWDLQGVLWDDLLLRVCRLTDPPKTRGKANLTVRRLPAFCEPHAAALRDRVEHLADAAKGKARFARDWRNRRISHSDLAMAVGEAEPLAPARLEDVTGALDAVHAVLNAISSALLDAEIANDVAATPRARAFLAYVRQLADSVNFVDAVVDADGAARITDMATATAFLEKLGLEPTHRNITSVIDLREAASRFD